MRNVLSKGELHDMCNRHVLQRDGFDLSNKIVLISTQIERLSVPRANMLCDQKVVGVTAEEHECNHVSIRSLAHVCGSGGVTAMLSTVLFRSCFA